MIVKVQRALSGDGILIYNQSRSVCYEAMSPLPEIMEALGSDMKAFFTAKLKGTVIHLGQRVNARDW